MSETRVVVGVWAGAGTQALFCEVSPGLPVLRLTLKRLRNYGDVHALVPWDRDQDHIAATLKEEWGWKPRRTHTDQRIAMRDLVAFREADYGVLVDGTCAVIDQDEIRLAIARLQHGVGEGGQYHSPRLRALRARDWLSVSDSTEWPEALSGGALGRFYADKDDLDRPAREVLARLR